jgi:primosomal protein N' (replication factor Y)
MQAHAVTVGSLRRALDRGWIEHRQQLPSALPPPQAREPPPVLTAEQSVALTRLQAQSSGTTLLEGVTGSGKTELYLRLAAEVLAVGRQVLVLTPEIGLTPQLAQRFAARFGDGVASFHSGLSETERARVWLGARDGRVQVIVGTRSAVLVPLLRPGLVIVDEEHDGSYKQQDGFRYSARDLAVLRAQRLGIPAVLGTATPSLETRQNAVDGRYQRVVLAQRISAQAPPRIGVVDIRHRPLEHGLSSVLIDAIERHLGAGGQALVFLNRRGYAPVLLCRDCGWVAPCPDCDARLVLHRGRNRLACHHCGRIEPVPRQCPDCGGWDLAPIGVGTERIEDALRLRFPGHRVERFDSDRLRKAGELRRLLDDVQRGAVDVLIGTQVLAKGHDFPQLSLAALVDVDQALYGSDFRALERMGQLVTQVAGRAGRRDQPGEVLLQSHQPEHLLLRTLLEQGYGAFADALLTERRQFGLPPFGYLALLRAEAPSESAAMRYLKGIGAILPTVDGVEVLGPAAATMARRAGHYRAQLLLKSGSRAALQRLLASAMPAIEALPASRRVRWSIDVDPGDLF